MDEVEREQPTPAVETPIEQMQEGAASGASADSGRQDPNFTRWKVEEVASYFETMNCQAAAMAMRSTIMFRMPQRLYVFQLT